MQHKFVFLTFCFIYKNSIELSLDLQISKNKINFLYIYVHHLSKLSTPGLYIKQNCIKYKT